MGLLQHAIYEACDQREQVRIHSADVGAQDVGAPQYPAVPSTYAEELWMYDRIYNPSEC